MSLTSLARSLHPVLLPLVEECQRSEKIKGKIAVTKVKSSILNGSADGNCDRFILSIPYCGSFIQWEVLFDCHSPTIPPDIIFLQEDSTFMPCLDNLQSLVDWDVSNNNSLVLLVEELLIEYRKHQLAALSSSQQTIEFQYTTLMESYNEKLIDVQCTTNKNETTTKFYISLDVDFSTIPTYFKKDNPGNFHATLSIIFKSPAKVEASLILSPSVERILGSKESIKLPKWSDTTYLMDYVPSVKTIVQDKVNFLMESFIKRKEYLASTLNILGNCVLEYDTDSYKMVSLLFDHQGFCFIAYVKFTDFFPKEDPLVSLISIYYKMDGEPVQVKLTQLPFNNQLEADSNIKKMMAHIVQMAPQFMDICKNKGTLL